MGFGKSESEKREQEMEVNPGFLIGGMVGAPIALNVLGRTFIRPKEDLRSQQEADAENRRLMRDFAIFNALLAGGLGYLAAKGNLSTNWQSGALGGAIATGLLATMLTGALITGPSVKKATEPVLLPPGRVPLPQTWASPIIGTTRTAGIKAW